MKLTKIIACFFILFSELGAYEDSILSWEKKDFLLYQGSIFTHLLRYQEAIQTLSSVINDDPFNPGAHIERAYAYFELDLLEQALKDYSIAKNLYRKAPFNYYFDTMALLAQEEDKLEFSKGLIEGITRGAGEYSIGVIPSVFGCLRGILHGLWALVISPNEAYKEVVQSAYSMGKFLSSCNGEEFLAVLIPEIRECSENWNEWPEVVKGQKLGYIIGRYSLEIFTPIAGSSAVKKYTALRRANTLATLEYCTNSSKKILILSEGSKRSALRNICVAQIRQGRILPKNSNVIYHVMQPKHSWEKLIKLTGNKEADFLNVVKLLEESDIASIRYRIRPIEAGMARAFHHEKLVKNYPVVAHFDLDEATGILLLKNAWVVSR